MKWISVKDKLPENGTIVLIYGHLDLLPKKSIYSGVYNYDAEIFVSIGVWIKNATHWMELPEAP